MTYKSEEYLFNNVTMRKKMANQPVTNEHNNYQHLNQTGYNRRKIFANVVLNKQIEIFTDK